MPSDAEFLVLRQTIASRGTVRMVLAPVTFFSWAGAVLVLMVWSDLPIGALLSLAVLAAGFEAVHALHVGVERIGRYLQVFHEEAAGRGQWEITAMQAGPPLPGAGVDPLFTVLFLIASVLNMIPALLPRPVPIELGVVGALHLAFVVRLVRARTAATRQRASDLEMYRKLQR